MDREDKGIKINHHSDQDHPLDKHLLEEEDLDLANKLLIAFFEKKNGTTNHLFNPPPHSPAHHTASFTWPHADSSFAHFKKKGNKKSAFRPPLRSTAPFRGLTAHHKAKKGKRFPALSKKAKVCCAIWTRTGRIPTTIALGCF